MHVALANAEAGQIETGLEIVRELIAGRNNPASIGSMPNCIVSRESCCCVATRPTLSDGPKMPSTRALEIARRQQTKTFELRSALGLARLFINSGRETAGSDLLTQTPDRS